MEKKKVLFVATVDSHIELFHVPYLKMFHDKGWEVHVATDTDKPIKYCDKKIKLPIKRSPFKIVSNFKAVRELRKIAKREGYEIVHCHTPMGGVVARLACKGCRRHGTRVMYTAHGFHFYTGAPLHFWLMFYPVEWYLAKYTDTLITINNEDYERAKRKFGKRCRDIRYVPGVGVDEKKFAKKMSTKEKLALRKKLGLKEDDNVLICVGRLDKNKNQGFLIEAMKELATKDSNYHLLLVGPDEINGKYQKLANKLGVDKNVHFLGFRNDISELMQISDVAVSASKREGLPVNLIEAAMLGLPIVATDCRGNRDVVCKDYLSLQGERFVDLTVRMFDGKNKPSYYRIPNPKDYYSIKNIMNNMVNKYFDYVVAQNYTVKEAIVNRMKKIRQSILLKKNKIGSGKRNEALNNKDITIISNNCFGGLTYEYLDLPYNSPTIGLYFFADDYIKFIYNLKHYLDTELRRLDPINSKHYDELVRLKQENSIIGVLDDVEIVFLHYSSFEEAKEKWERRCQRVNYDNMIIKFNDQNLCTEKELLAFHKFDAKNKICFTAKKYSYPEFYQLKKHSRDGAVRDDTFGYHKVFDVVSYVNSLERAV
ncbi:DUF1919 domain-containing protein [Candidatus Saccharibacteria bacterium]|nr:DUF1919 domain-containing protein [Candidatus Saccharibacteria bacterium]